MPEARPSRHTGKLRAGQTQRQGGTRTGVRPVPSSRSTSLAGIWSSSSATACAAPASVVPPGLPGVAETPPSARAARCSTSSGSPVAASAASAAAKSAGASMVNAVRACCSSCATCAARPERSAPSSATAAESMSDGIASGAVVAPAMRDDITRQLVLYATPSLRTASCRRSGAAPASGVHTIEEARSAIGAGERKGARLDTAARYPRFCRRVQQ